MLQYETIIKHHFLISEENYSLIVWDLLKKKSNSLKISLLNFSLESPQCFLVIFSFLRNQIGIRLYYLKDIGFGEINK